MAKHQFGGAWTEDKLGRIRKYLTAYARIFASNEQARHLISIYVDAFAGTGYRADSVPTMPTDSLFPAFDDQERAFLKGSARLALEIVPPFKQYVFVEQNLERIHDLELLRSEFPDKSAQISIVNDDANGYIARFCEHTDWSRSRAVIFLDPYGMQVEWSSLERLAHTRAADLWILFPLGIGVNRLLTRSGRPPEAWSRSLTRLFGTDTWNEAFYTTHRTEGLFGTMEISSKNVGIERITQYFMERLRSIFPAVAKKPRILYNSTNSPLYLLCFATANPKPSVQRAAMRISEHILT